MKASTHVLNQLGNNYYSASIVGSSEYANFVKWMLYAAFAILTFADISHSAQVLLFWGQRLPRLALQGRRSNGQVSPIWFAPSFLSQSLLTEGLPRAWPMGSWIAPNRTGLALRPSESQRESSALPRTGVCPQ